MAIHRKYNPGFLTDEELIGGFCVRTHEFESIIATLRDAAPNSSPHMIVIGPRGSGKTSLLLRVAGEIRADRDLAKRLLPVPLAEESYSVSTCGEFWLECIYQLAQHFRQTGLPSAAARGIDLERSWEELRLIQDDQMLEQRSLGALMAVASTIRRRLVLVVENLNALFRDMSDPVQAGWRLRHALQNEHRVILLGSATSRFDAMDRPDHALYDLLHSYTLKPLDTAECATLWESVSGATPPLGTARSLEILTGGNPRLLAIVARFGAHLSFRDLMDNMLNLVDEHTEYFRSHLEALPAQERRVYLALAEIWKPASARQVAAHARIDTSKCSSWLTRLVERGAVTVVGGTARRKEYYVTERMYNIYYLLRRHRGGSRVVEALVRFMVAFYSHERLREVTARLAADAKEHQGVVGHYAHALSILAVAASEPTRVQADPAESFRMAAEAYVGIFAAGEHGAAAVALASVSQVVCQLDPLSTELREGLSVALRSGRAIHLALDGQGASAMAELSAIEGEPRFRSLGPVAEIVHPLCKLFVLRSLGRHKEAREEGVKVLEGIESLRGPAEEYLAFLLKRIAEAGSGSLEASALAFMCAFIGSRRALMLIEESGAGDSVLPLVAALQMDLRQRAFHAKEVQEVADDILRTITQTRESFEMAKKAMLSTGLGGYVSLIGRRLRGWLTLSERSTGPS